MWNSIDALTRGLSLRCLAFGAGVGLAAAASAQTALSHAPDILFHDGFDGVAAGPFSAADAARLLTQATFGPTDVDIQHLRAIGYQAWLGEQFTAAPTYELTYLNWIAVTLGEQLGQDNRQEAWFLGALGGPDPQPNAPIHNDQLRQRVAFALSEIPVVSDQNPTLQGYPRGLAYYYDILARDAFGNYRQLLNDVTVSPAMGVYLNMMGNQRANSAMNVHPDENYAREINQLFSIGLVMLNIDGTPQLSNGRPIPTYTQATVTTFAHVFTGWNWASCDVNGNDNFQYCFTPYTTPSDFETPMVAYDQTNPVVIAGNSPSYHDNGTNLPDDLPNKQLLNYPGAAAGGVLANGGTAASDLGFALDNIYNHPNIAPFVGKQLIQRLVTSNPSPAYVARVATVFNNNRSSPTQLQSVVQAILLDPEARYGQWAYPDTFGKLREPLLRLTHLWRAMGAYHKCGQDVSTPNPPNPPTIIRYANQPYRYAGYSSAWNTSDNQYGVGIAQASLNANTVFNFFKPSFIPPGEMTQRHLLGPEFQINTDTTITNTSNAVQNVAFNMDVTDICDSGDLFGDVKINHAPDLALAGNGQGGPSDPSDRLVDAYNTRFMSGQMSPFMRQSLIDYLNTIDSSWPSDGSDWRLQRIDRALYLIFISPEYAIQK